MRLSNIRNAILPFCVFCAVGILAVSALPAQDSGYGTPAPAPTPAPSVPPDAAGGSGAPQAVGAAQGRGPQVDPKEMAAYNAFLAAKDSDAGKKIDLGKQFLKDYPKSQFAVRVVDSMAALYYTKGDLDNFNATADKALAMNPNNSTMLALSSWVIGRTYKDGEPNGQAMLDKAESEAKHAIELVSAVPILGASADPQAEKIKQAALAQAHSALGLVYFHEQKPDQAAAEMEQVTDPDSTSVFILGASYAMLGKSDQALVQFKKCSTMSGQLQPVCQAQAAQLGAH